MKRSKSLHLILASLLGCFLCSDCLLYAEESIEKMYQDGLFMETSLGNLEKAVEVYKQITEQHIKQREIAVNAYLRLGMCYQALGKKEEAVKSYQVVIWNFPDQTKQVDEARAKLSMLPPLSAVKKGRELDEPLYTSPTIVSKVKELVNQGNTLALRGEREKAKVKYEEVLKIDPRNSHALNQLGYLFMKRYNDPKTAIPYFEKAIKHHKYNQLARSNLIKCLIQLGNKDEARKHLHEYLELEPEYTNYYKGAKALLESLKPTKPTPPGIIKDS